MNPDEPVLLDAGVLIGALLRGDTRHAEALLIVEAAREGRLLGRLSVGILSEVCAATALTAGVRQVCTYDADDWTVFQPAGISVVAPASVLALL
ncbi:MAG: hypothetical protein NTW86_22055 [Candidatus Sumerlaeota bacterium]|nr:hypothetical protein [Candidatus Sumerlaeota bacterium]